MAGPYTLVVESPLGALVITGSADAITAVRFIDGDPPAASAGSDVPPVVGQCAAELRAYFAGTLQVFTVPVMPEGTAFQRRVWDALRAIPFGETRSYLEIARLTGDEKAVRAVGAANGQNPVAVIVPCHRVIGSDGSLVGYGGGLWRKEWLLAHEGRPVQGRLF